MNCFKSCLDCFRGSITYEEIPSEEVDERTPLKKEEKILKKCLLIGINYTGTRSELNGCINDSNNLKEFLIKSKYMKEEDITMMNDHCKGTELYPTKNNMVKQFKELVKYADKHKNEKIQMFVAYSGHGYHLYDYSGDEYDNQDEVLCTIDDKFIRDDMLKSELIDKLHEGVQLVFICDSCHSHTLLDFKYSFKGGKMVQNPDRTITSKCKAVAICGCSDDDYSSDAYIPTKTGRYQYQGAMTASFLATYKDGISYKDLIEGMRGWIKKNKFTQLPHLSTDDYTDTKDQFILGTYDV
jgi:hypothetical protein